MKYIKRYQLINESRRILREDSSVQKTLSGEDTSLVEVRVFLSHSHHDKDIIENSRIFLSKFGVKTYIDWKDPLMPPITSPQTAKLLKAKIETNSKFILLASEKAINSKWVPWELGYADKAKGLKNIAVFPVEEDSSQWIGSEYVGIYSTIQLTADNHVGVFSFESATGLYLHDWLRE